MSTRTVDSATPASADVVGRTVGTLARRVRTTRPPRLTGGVDGAGRDARRLRPLLIALGAVVAVVLFAKLVLPDGLPNSIVLLGVTLGALQALPALGVVLIYRANRIVNFSQGELGAFSASLAYLLMVNLGWRWWVAVPLSLVAATFVGGFVDFAIMRRFFASPRLIVTVATLGIAQLLSGVRLVLSGLFPESDIGFAGTFPSELGGQAFTVSGAIFRYDHVAIMVVVPVVAIGLLLFLQGSWAGLGARASSENLERSRLLGIPVRRLSTIIWALAGLMSGLAAILAAPVAGFSLITASGSAPLVSVLVAAAIGGFTRLGVTFLAAVALGVVQQAFFWNWSNGGALPAVELVALLIALLVLAARRRGLESGDRTLSWADIREVARVPERLRQLPQVRLAGLLAIVVAAWALLAAPRLLDSAHVNLMGLMGIHVIAALSLVILGGWAGQVSLGQWALVGVGAFVAGSALVRWELDFFLTLLLAAVVGGIVSIILGLPAQRLSGMMYGVTTIGFAAAAQSWLFQQGWLAPAASVVRPVLFGFIDVDSTSGFYYVVLLFTLFALYVTANLKRYRLGNMWSATRDNPAAAEALGVSVAAARRLAFFLSGAMAASAGVLYAFQQQVVRPDRFPPEAGLALFAIVVIGGLGSIPGVVIGAILVRGTQYLLPPWASFLTTGVGLLIVLLVFPGGLGELAFRVRDRVVAWLGGESGRLVDRRDVPEPASAAEAAVIAEPAAVHEVLA